MPTITRLVWMCCIILFLVMLINARSQQPDQQAFKQHIEQSENHKEISNPQNTNSTTPPTPSPLVPPKEFKKTTDDNGNHKEDSSCKRWRNILNSPGDFFVGVVALLTFLLVLASFYQSKITHAATRKQLRAYIFVDSIDVINMVAPPPETTLPTDAWVFQPNVGPMVHIVIKNSGQTPAYDVFIGAVFVSRNSPLCLLFLMLTEIVLCQAKQRSPCPQEEKPSNLSRCQKHCPMMK